MSSTLSLTNEGNYYDVNFFQYYPENTRPSSLPSAYLFEKALAYLFTPDTTLGEMACAIQQQQGLNRTLWGIRNENGRFSTEFYFFYPRKFPQNALENLAPVIDPYLEKPVSGQRLKEGYYLISFNPQAGKKADGINVYYPEVDASRPVITIADTGFTFNTEDPVFYSYLFDPASGSYTLTNTYHTFFGIQQTKAILDKMYEACRAFFPDQDPLRANAYLSLPYLYEAGKMIHSSAVTWKQGVVGLYFVGLSFAKFLQFLTEHAYPSEYVEALRERAADLQHLRYDVGLDFTLEKGEFSLKKTAFWGTF